MTRPIEDRLRAYGAQLDRLASTTKTPSVQPTPSIHKPGSQRPAWLPGVAVTLVVGAMIGAAFLVRNRGSQDVASPDSVDVASICGRWTPVPEAPISEQSRAVGVWTGTEFVVWGGRPVQAEPGSTASAANRGRRTGAAYSPSLQEWRQIAPSPISGDDTMVVVWTGSVVAVGIGDTIVAYDPVSDTWKVGAIRTP